jgi:hypothetical protein
MRGRCCFHANLRITPLPAFAQLRPEAVTRELSVDGAALVLNFAAVDMRTLRAAVGTFCDLVGLATRTLEAFGPAAALAGAPAEQATAADGSAQAAKPGEQQATGAAAEAPGAKAAMPEAAAAGTNGASHAAAAEDQHQHH